MDESTKKRQALRRRLEEGPIVVAPGVFDMLSARIADAEGFAALYMTGFGVAASQLGLPDAGLATFSDMAGRARSIAEGTGTPLVADADTGFGGVANVRHTVRAYERAGVAAIQIEDQEFPKKCGHTPGRRVIPAEDMVTKIRVAADSRTDPDFLIVARTDARTTLGLDEALRRAEAYARAGADVLFIESPESEQEMARIADAFDLPLVANLVEGGRTPILDDAALESLGFRLVIRPVAGLLAAAATLRAVYGALRQGRALSGAVALEDFEAFNRMIGFDELRALESRYDPAER